MHPTRGGGTVMKQKWESVGLYEHPAKHQAGTYGNVVLSDAGAYCLRVGSSVMSCPPDWAAAIHHEETKTNRITMTIPADLLEKLKAAAVGDNRSLSNYVASILAGVMNNK